MPGLRWAQLRLHQRSSERLTSCIAGFSNAGLPRFKVAAAWDMEVTVFRHCESVTIRNIATITPSAYQIVKARRSDPRPRLGMGPCTARRYATTPVALGLLGRVGAKYRAVETGR